MVPRVPTQPIERDRDAGTRAIRWAWMLLLASWPWHLVGGAIAIGITWFAGGDFTEGIGVPRAVYAFLFSWMLAPLLASAAIGVRGWLRYHRPAAIVPVVLSTAIMLMITVFGFDQFWG